MLKMLITRLNTDVANYGSNSSSTSISSVYIDRGNLVFVKNFNSPVA